jgi:hypothetical protein
MGDVEEPVRLGASLTDITSRCEHGQPELSPLGAVVFAIQPESAYDRLESKTDLLIFSSIMHPSGGAPLLASDGANRLVTARPEER